MKKLLYAFLSACSLLVPLKAFADEKTKACFIYVGPIGDFGWSYQHHQGALAMQKELGEERVELSYVESVPEGTDSERVLERLARSGCDVIFATSFGYMDAVNKVAARFPEVKFEHATGYKREHPNVSTYNSRFYEGHYIAGAIAGKTSAAGIGGFIASFPIPEVMLAINSFMLGAQSVNPDFKLKIVWVNSWFDPGKEADAAKTLFDQGVDVVTQQTNSTGPMQVAAKRGGKAIGLSSDMIDFGPTTQLTSVMDEWAPYYIDVVKSVQDGTWKQKNIWAGMKEGHVVLAPYRNMPDEAKAMAEALETRIKVEGFNPFTGPIFKQDGSEWLKAGEVGQHDALLSMNFYVKGIDNQMPQ